MNGSQPARDVITLRLAGSTPPAVRLVRAAPGDGARVAALGARLFAQAYDGLMDPADIAAYLDATYGEARQELELRDPCTVIWLADGGLEPGGFAMLRRGASSAGTDDGAAELARLYVDREWHGHRLGAALLAACVSEARAWNAERLWLSVWQQNSRAIAFYQRLGLRIVGEQDFVVGSDRQRDWIMALSLR